MFQLPFARGGARLEHEVDEELAFHLEMRAQRLVAQGWDPGRARDEAVRQFGDVGRVRRDCVTMDQDRERSMQRAQWMADVRQDLGYALRALRSNAGFAALVVGALAIGIGANTAIFTLVNAVLLRELPVSHPEQLVAIGNVTRVNSMSEGTVRTDLLSYPLYRDLRANAPLFTDLAATGRVPRLDLRVDGTGSEVEHPRGRLVSANYFSVLGVPALRGRLFGGAEDDVNGAAPVVVISHAYWTRRFQNDPDAIGRAIVLNGTRFTILGVTPPAFTGEVVEQSPDLWIPISMNDVLSPHHRVLDDRMSSFLLGLGRLAPGVTLERARREVPGLMERAILAGAPSAAAQAFLGSSPEYYVSSAARGFSYVRMTYRAPLVTLMIGVGLLLGIICANVATLLLARALARSREMAVRLAIGAGRARLVRQLLTESLLLASLGAAAGLALAWAGSRGLLALAGQSAGSLHVGLDLRVLGFTLLVSIGSVLLFGLVPALRASRADVASAIRANTHSVTGGMLAARGQRAPLGRWLIAGQVALSVILLVGAGMLVRSLHNIQTEDVGLDRDHLLIVDLDIRNRGYAANEWPAVVHALRDRVARLPGVAAVGYSENGIFSGTESATNVSVASFTARTLDDTTIAYDQAGPGYVNAIGGHLLAGRDFLPSDETPRVHTALVNESLAKFYFPHGEAVGQYLHLEDSVAIEIVGVLADTRDHALDGPPARRAYFPYAHHDPVIGIPIALRLEVRTVHDPAAVGQQIRQVVRSLDPRLTIVNINPVRQLMRRSIAQDRLVAQLAAAFGVLALVLASLGLYGVMTYAIGRRTGEIALRIALGAQHADVLRLIVADAVRLVALGLVVGLPLALASTRLLRAQLHAVGAVDLVSIAAAISVLLLSGVAAVAGPARRAARVSPVVAL